MTTLDAAVTLVDRVLLVEQLGMRRAEVKALRAARDTLFARRVSRGGK